MTIFTLQQNKRELLFASLILFVAVLFSSFLVTYAQTTDSTSTEPGRSQITFPIPELGNCNSREECKAYCDDSSHATECTSFAEAHGLIKKESAEKARAFQEKLRAAKAGPGGCTTPKMCHQYCSDSAHLEECVTFAEKNGISDDGVRQGRKFLEYIKSGGETPGGCKNEVECKTYCQDFSHAEECQAFREKLGFDSPRDNSFNQGQGLGKEGASKLVELVKNGETPGACKNKSECEAYCKDQSHAEECTAFALKIGALRPEEAERINKFAEGGPGGCQGPEACKAFCAEEANRQVCFDFAREHNLIPQEQLQNMKENATRLKNAITNAPDAVKQCITELLPQDAVSGLDQGILPNPEVGNRVKECFEKNRPTNQGDQNGFRQMPQNGGVPMNGVPEEVKKCVIEKSGTDPFSGAEGTSTDPQRGMSEAVRKYLGECMQQFGPFRPDQSQIEASPRQDSQGRPFQNGQNSSFSPFPRMQNPRVAPLDKVMSCVEQALGGDYLTRVESGELSKDTVESAMKKCTEKNESAFPFSIPRVDDKQGGAFPRVQPFSDDKEVESSELENKAIRNGRLVPLFSGDKSGQSGNQMPGQLKLPPSGVAPSDPSVPQKGVQMPFFGGEENFRPMPGQQIPQPGSQMPRPFQPQEGGMMPGSNQMPFAGNEGAMMPLPQSNFVPPQGEVKPQEPVLQPTSNQGGSFINVLKSFVKRFSE